MGTRSPSGSDWADDVENLWLTEAPGPFVNSSFKIGTATQVGVHTFRDLVRVGNTCACKTASTKTLIIIITMQTEISLSAMAAAQFYFLRTGQEEEVHVDARHAILEFSKPILLRTAYDWRPQAHAKTFRR